MATAKRDIRLVKSQRETKKKIASPLAKYNSAGQLFCVLCNVPVKSAILWDSHVLGKKHKENLTVFKRKSNKSQSATNERQLQEKITTVKDGLSNARPVLKRTSQDEMETVQNTPEKKLKVDSEENTDRLKMKEDDEVNSPDTSITNTPSNLPSDFFDSPQQSEQAEQTPDPGDSTEGIPEGFFDDPKLDAKVRKVEYRDPAEEEWEKFQKAMQVEAQVSQSIVEEEDEESRVDREFSELSEQRLYYLRAGSLRDKQSIIKDKVSENKILQKESQEENNSNSDDSDYEEFFDWRAKKVS
ncbi:zinc finger protein 830-like [Porites lutea]|uniref:zinc finger protein 830-like n=1 Tax=Porites lutea TaxID=51062 RepID=UPI003CC53D76